MAWQLGAGKPGGKIRRLKRDVFQYLSDRETYTEKMQLWAGNPDLPEPEAPTPPYPLVLYHQIERFGIPLVAGGILNQPTEAWLLVNAAGAAEAEWLSIKQKLLTQQTKRPGHV